MLMNNIYNWKIIPTDPDRAAFLGQLGHSYPMVTSNIYKIHIGRVELISGTVIIPVEPIEGTWDRYLALYRPKIYKELIKYGILKPYAT